MAVRKRSRPTKDEDASASPSRQALLGESSTSKGRSPTPDICPACPPDRTEPKANKKETWVFCEGCQVWYHWHCVSDGGELSLIDKWYCAKCRAKDPSFIITYKPPAPPARKSARQKIKQDYANMNDGLPSDPNMWIRILKTKKFAKDTYKRMKGSQLTMDWVESDEDALKEPIVIPNIEGLGMQMPGEDFTVADVAELVGPATPVEVIDVASQSDSPGNWSLKSWAEYYNAPVSERDKILNVISLEVTNTKLSEKITPPRLVQQLDWVQKIWPANRKGKGQFPKVGLYCLMSVAQSWTDWHVDFAASSVYYHVLRGAKDFYFIRPTADNLAAYEKWSGSAELQAGTWLGDMVDNVVKVSLVQGNTMIIPTGWIHAVFTPVDSLVFGGNFLHSYNISTQLRLREIEIATKVPKKHRFPFFQRMCWYVADHYVHELKAHADISPRVLKGLATLADFLISEVRILEGTGDSIVRRETKEQIPTDKVKDAPALARELKWRVRLAQGEDPDAEDVPTTKAKANGKGKRKRSVDEGDADVKGPLLKRPRFKNFEPQPWDQTLERDLEEKTSTVVAGTFGDWVMKPGALDNLDKHGSEGVEYVTGGKEWLRIRKAVGDNGRGRVERVRITKVVESWSWGAPKPVKVEKTVDEAILDGGMPPGDMIRSGAFASEGDIEMKDYINEDPQEDDSTDGTLLVTEVVDELAST